MHPHIHLLLIAQREADAVREARRNPGPLFDRPALPVPPARRGVLEALNSRLTRPHALRTATSRR